VKRTPVVAFIVAIGAALLLTAACAGVESADSGEVRDMNGSDAERRTEADEYPGIWEGTLTAGGQDLTIVFRSTAEGWVMDSPDQGARDIPAQFSGADGGGVRIEVPLTRGYFEGSLTGEGALDGMWHQGGQQFPLVLVRTDAPRAFSRPQDPRPPLPYRVEVVRFRNETAGITLEGELTLPPGEGPFPGVALVSGSGPQNRDEELLGHRPFLVLADHLTRRGIAVLRFDDRGVGRSEGDFASGTSEDFAADALAARQYLAARPETDAGRTGILGHSEGGLIGIYLGYRHETIPFLVLLAPSVIKGDQQLMLQNEIIMRRSGLGDDVVSRNSAVNREIYDIALSDSDAVSRRERIAAILTDLGLGPADAAAQAEAMLTPWMQFFLTYDPSSEVNGLTMPTLALFGTLDTQVDAVANAAPISNPAVEIRVYDGLNHLFQQANSGLPAEYGSISETINPRVMDDIADWILGR
jgi:pimeloyl-ACP methyl ester carboxylesterase